MLGQDCPHFLDNIHQKVRLQLASLAPAPLSPPHSPLRCLWSTYPASPCVFMALAGSSGEWDIFTGTCLGHWWDPQFFLLGLHLYISFV